MVLEAEVHLIGPNGPRSMPLSEFYALDGILEMSWRKAISSSGSPFLSVPRTELVHISEVEDARIMGFPGHSILDLVGTGDVTSLRVASTALESIPRDHAEQVAAHHATWRAAPLALGQAVQKAVKPVNNTAMPPRYRRSMVSVLTRRALTDLEGGV